MTINHNLLDDLICMVLHVIVEQTTIMTTTSLQQQRIVNLHIHVVIPQHKPEI